MPKAALLVGLCLLLGCGRWAGPHENEVGKLAWWLLIEGGARGETGCAATGDHRTYMLTNELPYQPGRSWYLNFEVLPDRTSAVSWDCNFFDWTDCRRRPDMTWSIAEHTYTIVEETVTSELGDDACRIDVVKEGRLDDRGTKGTFTISNRFVFVGDAAACERIDADYRARDLQGLGLRECVLFWEYPFVFSHVAPLPSGL